MSKIYLSLIAFFVLCSMVSAYECYQETANVSTSCGGLNTGIYGVSNNYIYINYTIPPNANEGTIWETSYATSNLSNFTLPLGCENNTNNKIVLRMYSNQESSGSPRGISGVYCNNWGTWITLDSRNESTGGGFSGNGYNRIYDGNWGTYIYYSPTLSEWKLGGGGRGGESLVEEAIIWNMSSVSEISQSYSNETYEYTYETFSISLYYEPSIYTHIEANLIYNNTERSTVYSTGSGNIANFSDYFSIEPVTTEINNTFYWNITLVNATGNYYYATNERNQTVKMISLTECGITKALNFTAKDQSTNNRIPSYDFKGTFNYFINDTGNYKNISFNNLSINELKLCLTPNITMYINAIIEYNAPNYQVNNYYFNNYPISNISQDITLFLLNSSASTSFIIKVQDVNQIPLHNYDVYIYRYYPATDSYLLVQIVRTDEDGKSVAFFVTETVDYKFIVKDTNGTTVLETDKRKIIPETTPYTITLTVGSDLENPLIWTQNLTGLTYSIYFNKTTNITTLTYLDTDSSFLSGILSVNYLNYSGDNNLICNTSSLISGWTLTCDLTGNRTGSYSAQFYLIRDSNTYLITQYLFEIEDFTTQVGYLGILGAFFILLICATAFAYNETAGIIMMNLGVIFVNVIKLVNFGLVFITGMISVSILILIIMERR
jgi:hypothetical protein